jgi:hypothetical protein
LNLRTIPREVRGDVSSISEEIHDVAKISRVIEAQGVPEFVQTGEVYDAVPEKVIGRGALRKIRTQRCYVRPDENRRSAPAMNH